MKEQTILLPVTKIQRFSTHDGPGIRTTVFLKGCPLHCRWCHNPETQSDQHDFFYTDDQCIHCGACAESCPQNAHLFTPEKHTLNREKCTRCMACVQSCPAGALESCQQMLTLEEILAQILRDKPFYGKDCKKGGVTLSGGEPMMHGEKAISLLNMCKEAGLHTALETCGVFDPGLVQPLSQVTDLFLWDIKDTCEERHQHYTGAGLHSIHQNLKQADALGVKTVLRCIMLKGINMVESHYDGIAALYRQLHHCLGVELIPCHGLGESKYVQLGMEHGFQESWIPSDADMRAAHRILGKQVKLI